jgi:hypothetical protein
MNAAFRGAIGPLPLLCVDNAGVFVARLVMTQEILILRENEPVLREGKRDVLGVGSRNQVRIGRGRVIQPLQTQSMSDRMVYVLVKMKPDHCPNP